MAIVNIWSEVDKFATKFCSSRGLTYSGTSGSVEQLPLLMQNIVATAVDNEVTGPPKIAFSQSQTFTNVTSEPQRSIFEYHKEIVESTSSTTSTGVTTGVSVESTQEFNIKFVEVGITQTVSTEVNITNEQTNTTSETQRMGTTQEITIPPYSVVKATIIIEEGEYRFITKLTCDISGFVYFDTTSGARFWTSIYDVLKSNNTPHFTFTFEDPSDPTCHFDGSGSVKGNQGLQSYVRVEESPLPGKSGQSRKYTLPGQTANSLGIIPLGTIQIPVFN
ncbi:ETX/MTX2 family pore-forming toxin [Bacillus mycoides]|uniref:ETX/MTX2 family pore-forming toxin n=1 Tax=Bacillus mycoides TaxID=1405 RepID=UPI003D64C23E